MYLLPEMRSEDLNQGYLECGNLPVHEDAGQIELHLETHVHISSVYGWRPPECEAAIRNLI